MRESLKDFFEGVSIKNTIFLIIWSAGIIGWIYFTVSFTETRAEANWTYQEVQKLQKQRIENIKDNGDPVESSVKTESQVEPIKAKAEDLSSAPASGSIEEIIYNYFKDDYQIAKAVFTAESHLNPKAKGHNCYYDGKSQACKKGDEDKAWSVDCGIAQLNIRGKDCPENLYNPDENLRLAREKYQSRGWQPWCAFTSKKYLAYLK